MIRLNDINKTVIDESKVVAYYAYEEEKDYCVCIALNGNRYVDYNSQEQRDKDIELLDQLFEVKKIEKVVDQTPYEGEKTCGPKQLTWDYVKQFECGVNAYLPEGSICKVYYEEDNDRIQLGAGRGYIYDEDLFNVLMLKKVE
jgi:hypothetical protein